MASLFNIGVSALNAFSSQLAVTGNNIANVNTVGYSRQTAQLSSQPSQLTPAGYIGAGVSLDDITRSYDQFLAGNLRSSTSLWEESSYLSSRASQIDNLIADPSAGLTNALSGFFDAVQDVANDPTSIPARAVMLNQAEMLVDRFASIDGYIEDLRRQSNADMDAFVGQINRLTGSIAEVNQRILESGGAVGNNLPNDLLDQRDLLLDQLSEYVSITTTTQTDGSINVFIGSGQPLVVGSDSNNMVVQESTTAGDEKTLSVRAVDGSLVDVTGVVSGGKLGGLMRFQQEVLNPTQDAIGLTAIGLAEFFNDEHMTGLDLNGDLGTAFFSVATPELLGDSANAGTATASFSDLSAVQADEYDLRYDGASWLLFRTDSNELVSMTGSGTAADPFVAEGVSIVIGPGAAAGDHYLLRPTRSGASDIGVLIKDPTDIAAADVLHASAGSANTGSATITAGALQTLTGSTIPGAPIALTYNTATLEFTYPPAGTIPYDPATDSGVQQTINIAGLGDFSFVINGSPANGDQLLISDNTGAVGDNRNARALGSLQAQTLLLGGRASITDSYGFAVAEVGTITNRALTTLDVQQQLRDQAQASKDSVSGVNLDEEAANLVQYQQAYQAAAQVIATANSLIDTLLGVVR